MTKSIVGTIVEDGQLQLLPQNRKHVVYVVMRPENIHQMTVRCTVKMATLKDPVEVVVEDVKHHRVVVVEEEDRLCNDAFTQMR